ncbi:DDE-type integrase/transposase/recombinase [Streptomyces pimonensis]|uniref:DDE-type integrase/transposase/recombinase n=1 Tax=Streptomyces pimonensis TaxID=2860288 RepID=A0ABV4JBV8_9ACTN
MDSAPPSCKGRRCPVEVIAHCVWLCFRFPLGFREAEEPMLGRGVMVSHETVRRWCVRFGQSCADGLRRRRPRPGDKWHLDEVFIRVDGERKYLWRGRRRRRHRARYPGPEPAGHRSARRFFRRLPRKACPAPRVVVADKPRSYKCGPSRGDALGGTPLARGPEQPGRELPPARPAARACHEGLPQHRRNPAVPVRVQRHPTPLPAPPPPDDRRHRPAHRNVIQAPPAPSTP